MYRVLGKAQDTLTRGMYGAEKVPGKEAFYELVDRNMNSNEIKMSKFQGNILCLVNIASK